MKCPKCNCRKFDVLDTRKRIDFIARRRRCCDCSHVFWTREVAECLLTKENKIPASVSDTDLSRFPKRKKRVNPVSTTKKSPKTNIHNKSPKARTLSKNKLSERQINNEINQLFTEIEEHEVSQEDKDTISQFFQK